MSPRRMGALVLAVAAAGSCGQDVAGEPDAGPTGVDPATSELSALDPCAMLSDAEIKALGFRPDTRRPTETLGLVGCAYLGPPNGVLGSFSVEKEPEDTVADYAARAIEDFRENEVNGRAGAQTQSFGDGTDCAQIVDEIGRASCRERV